MTYKEISKFLSSFNTNSYNRSQIGNKKQTIINIYELLKKLNINSKNIEILIRNIAYLNYEEINIPLYIELLSKSYGFINIYELKDVIKVVKEVHNLYFKSSPNIPLEEYLHDTPETRIKKIFLNRNNKYIMKNFTSPEYLNYISDLKLASAIELNQKEYKEFISYINEYEKYQNTYSTLSIFKTYRRLRKYLKDNSQLFWDIFFGNEYIVGLIKYNIKIEDIYKKNIYHNYQKKSSKEALQLDLFTYQEETIEPEIKPLEDLKVIQFCTIYNSNKFIEEKELLNSYHNLLNSKEKIELPKLKENKNNYVYNVNI